MEHRTKSEYVPTGFARLRGLPGLAGRVRRTAAALRRMPREEVSPAGRWIEDHGPLLLDAADALARDTRFAPALPAVGGTPRVLLLVRAAVLEPELSAPGLVRCLRDRLNGEELAQAELNALPQALARALLEGLLETLDACAAEPDLLAQAKAWAAALSRGQKERLPHDPLLLHLVLLQLDALEDAAALGRADELLGLRGLTAAEANRQAQQALETEGLRAGKAIAALQALQRLPFDRIRERLSPIAAALRQDASYRRMDAESRAYYRRCVCRIARRCRTPEGKTARAAVALTEGREGLAAEAGYYLIEHPEEIEKSLGRRPGPIPPARRQAFLLLPLYGAAAVSLWAGVLLGAPWYAWPLIPLAFSEIFRQAYRRFLARRFPPRLLPRLRLRRIPDEARTLVVIPCLLTSPRQAMRMARQLAALRAANPDPNLEFMLLGDFADSPEETDPGDDGILLAARLSVEALNGQGGRCLYLQRARKWDMGQRRFTGRERKRGALEALNRLIAEGACRDTFAYMSLDGAQLRGRYAFVITLDADTFLPAGAARQLVGAMLHPLQKGRVGVIQPRMEVGADTVTTRAQALLGGPGGADPYHLAVQDAYQDAFGRGSFVGKGIYAPEAWLRALEGRLPSGRLLSHDLIEGEIVGSALAEDIVLYDGHPVSLSGWQKRLHRWTRGDWQLLPFLLDGRLSRLSRHKIWDNLRRSLLPVGQTALLLMGAGGNLPLLFLLALPWPPRGLGIRTLLLPGKALTTLDAALRALWRQFVSHRKLLSWVTAAQAEGAGSLPLSCVFAQLLAGVGLLALSLRPGGFLAGAAVGAAWVVSPLLLPWLEGPARRQRPMNEAQRRMARSIARDTWRFFEASVSADTRFLPPDNVQTDPEKGPALRTSPTNMGLYLLSCCAARELHFISSPELARRLEDTLSVLEGLEAWKGHLYNWYDLETAKPLPPRFVSTVDSGNFAACLLCCAQLCRKRLREFPEDAVSLPARLDALARRADFGALYDQKAQLLLIGRETEANRPTPAHYDALASEARLTSYLAIMTGQVEREHWQRLSRKLTWAGGGPALLSWGGTMFEYLMPALLLPSTPGTLLGESCLNAIRAQMNAHPDRPFGVSESGYGAFDPDMNYQYRAFGLPALAQSPDVSDAVVAPYASALALPFFPWAAAENLSRMRKLGWQDSHGFFEAADYAPQRIGKGPRLVKSHMAHHQGMILCALCNALTGQALVRAFMTPAAARAHSDLLLEQAPRRAARRREFPGPRQERETAASFRRTARRGLPVDAHVLYGGGTTWVLTARGQGALSHNGLQAARFIPRAGAQTGPQFYLRNPGDGAYCRLGDVGSVVFESGRARAQGDWQGVAFTLLCCVDPLSGMAVAALKLRNPGPEERRLEAVSFLEIAQGSQAADEAHAAFRDLSIRVSPWGERGLLSERLPRDEGDAVPPLGHAALGDGWISRRQGDRAAFLGRRGSYARPAQLTEATENRLGDVIAPCFSLTVGLQLPGHGKATVYFVTAFGDGKGGLGPDAPSLGRVKAAFSLASTQAAMTARQLRLDGNALSLYQQMAGPLLFAGQPHQQAFPPASRKALWALGVSGGLPVLLIRLDGRGDGALIRHGLRAHAWLQAQGVGCDLIFCCPPETAYHRPCRDQVTQCLNAGPARHLLGAAGGVHIAEGGEAEAQALESLARLTLRSGQPLRGQLQALPGALPAPEEEAPARLEPVLPGALAENNGFGGYTRDGAYCVYGPAPVPWHQLVCGAAFGTLVCEEGILGSYAGNSRLGRVTRWSQDVFRALPGEEILLLDEEGKPWRLTGGAAMYEPGMATYHGMAGQILCQTAVFSHPEKPLGLRTVTLRSEKEQRAKLFWLVRFALGEAPEFTRCRVTGNLVTAFQGDFSGAAWAAMEEGQAQTLPAACCENGVPLGGCAFTGGSAALFCGEITLRPREPRRLTLALGCAPEELSARRDFEALLEATAADAARRVRGLWSQRLSGMLLFSDDEALGRAVNRWLPYQVWAARLLARCGPYQPGGAIGFRDQLQDCLALLYTQPAFVKDHILLCAAHQFREGDVQHWWHPPRFGVRTRVSDDKLFLPYLTAQYVAVTGDREILALPAPYLDGAPLSEEEKDRCEEPALTPWAEPLLSHCLRAIDSVALGPHGIPLMGGGDWNDGMNRVGGVRGESVWLGFFLALVLKDFGPLCPPEIKEKYQLMRRGLLDALESAWTGQWYLRAWYDDGRPLGGPDTQPPRIDLISQCFAVLGGAPRNHARAALAQAVEKLYDREAGLVKLLTPPFIPGENAGYIGAYLPGVRENGGQYTHAVPWLISALCRVGEYALAWEIARAILPGAHADTPEKAMRYQTEPYVLCGDVYAGLNRGRGGWSWYTGSAAWLYWVVITELLGFEKRADRARLRPVSDEKLGAFTLIYRVGGASYHLTADPDALFVTLDGAKSDDGWVDLKDDGRIHEARFPLR